MKKIVFIVEKTTTGYSAYAENFNKFSVGTTGINLAVLRQNILEASNLYQEHQGRPAITDNDIAIQLDLPQFFDFYKEINAKALSNRVGINQTLLSQYINGHKKPSNKQVHRILDGIKQLGQELSRLDLADA
ncbi:MAG: hypothetical protein WBP45_11105 [Daejeonella sp.]